MKVLSQKRNFPAVSLRDIPAALMLCAACGLLILYRDDAAAGVLSGIYTCLNTLVPSLFPFVLLSCVAAKSAAMQLLFRPLSPLMHRVFHLPACAAPALLFGLTTGYPTGAKITASLYADGRLTKEQAARLLCFCTAPGYAFSIFTGMKLTGSTHTGLLLFLACILAPLLTGAVLARFAPLPEKMAEGKAVSGDFTDAVRDGVSAMVAMCGFVVVFAGLLSVLQSAGIFRTCTALLARCGLTVPAAGAVFSFLLEVTAGVTHSAYWHLSPALAAFGLGFAGICIHLQIRSFFRGTGFPLSSMVYFLTRLLNGLLATLCYRVLSYFFPASASAAAAGESLQYAASAGTAAASAALLALSLFFLLFCMQKSRREKGSRLH